MALSSTLASGLNGVQLCWGPDSPWSWSSWSSRFAVGWEFPALSASEVKMHLYHLLCCQIQTLRVSTCLPAGESTASLSRDLIVTAFHSEALYGLVFFFLFCTVIHIVTCSKIALVSPFIHVFLIYLYNSILF